VFLQARDDLNFHHSTFINRKKKGFSTSIRAMG
jgi:hypothetical protein